MIRFDWQVRFVRGDLPCPASPLPFVRDLPSDLDAWLDAADILEGTPFLLSPSYEYDVALNGFFQGFQMAAAP